MPRRTTGKPGDYSAVFECDAQGCIHTAASKDGLPPKGWVVGRTPMVSRGEFGDFRRVLAGCPSHAAVILRTLRGEKSPKTG